MVKYNLAFVIEKYFQYGGLQRDMLKFAHACHQRGHTVTIFTSQWDGPPANELTVELCQFKALSNHQTIKNIARFVHALKAQNKFDAIVGFNRVSGLDVYFNGDPCIKAKLKLQNKYWLIFLPRYRTYLKLEAALFDKKSETEVLVLSPIELEHINKLYNYNQKKLHLLKPGISLARLKRPQSDLENHNKIRKQFNLSGDDFMILTIGSNFTTKGIDRSIHAINSLPGEIKQKCHYVVVGIGKEDQFKAIAEKGNIADRVHFIGGNDNVAEFYHGADLLLHVARSENTGLALLEAMTCGLPVIATGICGYATYITEANGGMVVPEPFKQATLNAFLKTALSKAHLKQWSSNAHTFCKDADIYSMCEQATEVILSRAKRNREKNGLY